MNDFLKTPIAVGDRVVYPGRRSSSVWMNTGQVVEVDDAYRWGYRNEKEGRIKVRRSGYNGKPKDVWIEHLDRVVVVK